MRSLEFQKRRAGTRIAKYDNGGVRAIGNRRHFYGTDFYDPLSTDKPRAVFFEAGATIATIIYRETVGAFFPNSDQKN